MLLNAEPMRPPTIIIAPAIPAVPSPYPERNLTTSHKTYNKRQRNRWRKNHQASTNYPTYSCNYNYGSLVKPRKLSIGVSLLRQIHPTASREAPQNVQVTMLSRTLYCTANLICSLWEVHNVSMWHVHVDELHLRENW